MSVDRGMGGRVALYRRRRGLSQKVLAELVGRSESWLSQVERGILPLENLNAVLRLAEVLRVEPTVLTGSPLRLAPNGGVHLEEVEALRQAINSYGSLQGGLLSVADEGDLPSLSALETDIPAAWAIRHQSRYRDLANLLPDLLRRAEIASERYEGDDRIRAYGLLADVYQLLRALMRKIGETQYAWVAGDRGMQAARLAGLPLSITAVRGAPGRGDRRSRASEGLVTAQLDAMRVVDEPVEDGVGYGGITECLVPVLHWRLAGDDGRAALGAVLDDLQQVGRLLAGQRLHREVVKDQDTDAGPAGEQPGHAPIYACDGELVDHAREAHVERGVAFADGGLGECASDVGLPKPSGADDQDVLVGVDPARLRQLKDQCTVQSPRGMEVDVLEAGLVAQPRRLEVAAQATVLALLQLSVDEHAEPVVEAERLIVGALHLLLVGARHAEQLRSHNLSRVGLVSIVFSSSLVVVGATQVLVVTTVEGSATAFGQGLAVEPVLQDRLDAAVAQRTHAQARRQAASSRGSP